MTSTDARQVWNIALSEDRRYQVLCTFFITCYLTCQHCKWGKPQCHASINKAYKILCCLLDLAQLIDWVNDLAKPRGCLRCHFVSQLPKHGQSPQWRLERGNGLPAGCCVVLHACVLELITGSCDAIDIFLFKKRKREWNRKSCSIQLSILRWKHRVQKNKTKSKNPHLYISQVPLFLLRFIPLPPGHLPSPLLFFFGGASCSLFIVGEGRELAKATLHLSLSPSYRLVCPLTRKRSAPCAPPVFSSPKKGRAQTRRGDRRSKQ